MMKNMIVIDTETTGLSPYNDEMLQVSCIDGSGNVLLNTYLHPVRHTSWPDAQRVNHISSDMVASAPTYEEIMPKVQKLFDDADAVIGYNVGFDLGFLRAAGLIITENMSVIDVMLDFAEIYGEWNDYFGDYKWQTLVTCAQYYKYDASYIDGGAHDSLADVRATLYCYQKMHPELEQM